MSPRVPVGTEAPSLVHRQGPLQLRLAAVERSRTVSGRRFLGTLSSHLALTGVQTWALGPSAFPVRSQARAEGS